jgi:hypothetical protein
VRLESSRVPAKKESVQNLREEVVSEVRMQGFLGSSPPMLEEAVRSRRRGTLFCFFVARYSTAKVKDYP